MFNLLVVIGGILLLLAGRYPRPLCDFLLGLNRWLFRVLAYVALMTVEYPLFRLDTDGEEPSSVDEAKTGSMAFSAKLGKRSSWKENAITLKPYMSAMDLRHV